MDIVQFVLPSIRPRLFLTSPFVGHSERTRRARSFSLRVEQPGHAATRTHTICGVFTLLPLFAVVVETISIHTLYFPCSCDYRYRTTVLLTPAGSVCYLPATYGRSCRSTHARLVAVYSHCVPVTYSLIAQFLDFLTSPCSPLLEIPFPFWYGWATLITIWWCLFCSSPKFRHSCCTLYSLPMMPQVGVFSFEPYISLALCGCKQ